MFEKDSIFIYCTSNQNYKSIFTNYIEIKSPKHTVKLKDRRFNVGLKFEEFSSLLPEIYNRYNDYIKTSKTKIKNSIYISVPLIIETKEIEVPFYYCQGLKFEIKNNKVISILIDFRSDGDLD
ncbi:hypothetical protein [Tenuifilum thalassicum]|uniref:Uncharacterized protein n=1 Tax=Tenuifilum thalassicum TaxID=2590900 RepID=A0A7D3XFH9_9BACT|nr:hypothetical protein [Tenuifilum thalassicum]QKG80887.1 hypothetical protein FHG85_11645 [Tenuifilum thalassicum]